jgi:hypothetical protein
MKKILPILLVVIIIAIVVGGFVFGRGLLQKNKSSETTNPALSKPKVENVNQLPLEKRPYIVVEPKSETRPQDYGHWITVTIDKASAYQSVEYDVEYQAGNLIQGFMHRIDFTKESLPAAKEGFFGSESKGKYKYDENVKSGSILFKFFKDSKTYDALKAYFNLQNMAEQKGVFTSNDGKATLEVGTTDLDSGDYLVITSTLGLPAPVTGKVLSEPYGFYDGKAVAKLKNAQLSIRNAEDLAKAKILGWDGSKWQEYKITTNSGLATAKITQLGTYILVSD